ncbi:MAG: GC-type dockerin domain-anchored protein [Phycisphaerales bacterium]
MNHSATTIAASLFAVIAAQSQSLAQDFCVTPNASIIDNTPAGIMIPIQVDVSPSESVASLEVSLDIAHDWVGDLVIRLRAPSGTEITLMNRPGIPSSGIPSTGFPGPFGCGGQNIDATFSDQAAVAAESLCSTTAVPVITGMVIPDQPLGTLIAEPAAGQWVLIISDESITDAGVVLGACLSLTTTINCPADLTADGNLNFLDVSAFLTAFGSSDPIADFTNDGNFNFLDVSEFLSQFGQGCP